MNKVIHSCTLNCVRLMNTAFTDDEREAVISLLLKITV
jgi:hypothetical protein